MVEGRTKLITNNWYSWLNLPYRQFIKQYYMKRAYPAILFHGPQGLGLNSLIWKISSWLMCSFSKNLQSCGICHSCNLMKVRNHPDFVTIESSPSIGIDIIRNLYDKIFQRSQLGRSKVIWISESDKLTESASNALLKTLEEPPDNTYFFLYSSDPSNLSAILRSRCQYWKIIPPIESEGMQWIKLQLNSHRYHHLTEANILAALRLASGAPLAAVDLLSSMYWTYRHKIYEIIRDVLNEKQDLLNLLPLLNNENVNKQIEGLCTLFLDAIKLQYDSNVFIINYDVKILVHQLSILSVEILYESFRNWLILRHLFTQVISVNRQLLLTQQLLHLKQLIDHSNKRDRKICF
ncbi:MAG: DNA polymerase III subunit delta' C-terminal domain-containing protein [Candidatus Dasytiphilus stammeri]